MRSLFLDTAGWFAAIAPSETGHAKARRAYTAAATSNERLVTTPFVIAEMHALMLRWRGVAGARQFLDLALTSGTHRVIEVDGGLIAAAVDRWIRRFDDKPFSLCDAVSFEVMRRERIARVLTLDRHFALAGFELV